MNDRHRVHQINCLKKAEKCLVEGKLIAARALIGSFTWNYSPEGWVFWNTLYFNLNKLLNPTLF